MPVCYDFICLLMIGNENSLLCHSAKSMTHLACWSIDLPVKFLFKEIWWSEEKDIVRIL